MGVGAEFAFLIIGMSIGGGRVVTDTGSEKDVSVCFLNGVYFEVNRETKMIEGTL